MGSTISPSSGEYLLEMRGINKSFPGVKALDNVNLNVRPYSIHALMGENGAGKSTLLKCLSVLPKRFRQHCISGKRSGLPFGERSAGEWDSMVHQELNLVLQRSVMDNMWLGRYPTKGMLSTRIKCTRIPKRY